MNSLDAFTLEYKIITRQEALIPAEAVENDQESMAPRASCSNKVGSTTSLVSSLFVLQKL